MRINLLEELVSALIFGELPRNIERIATRLASGDFEPTVLGVIKLVFSDAYYISVLICVLMLAMNRLKLRRAENDNADKNDDTKE